MSKFAPPPPLVHCFTLCCFNDGWLQFSATGHHRVPRLPSRERDLCMGMALAREHCNTNKQLHGLSCAQVCPHTYTATMLQLSACPKLVSLTCAGINKLLEQHPVPEGQYTTWIDSVNEVRQKFPMWYPEKDDVIIPQWAIQVRQTVVESCTAIFCFY